MLLNDGISLTDALHFYCGICLMPIHVCIAVCYTGSSDLGKYEGHFFMFAESGCISTNIEFTVP